jgi:hypothetical protein
MRDALNLARFVIRQSTRVTANFVNIRPLHARFAAALEPV